MRRGLPFLVFFWAVVLACTRVVPAPDDLEARAREIDRLLICPVCPGETLDQSQADLAKQMRALVRQMLAEGKGREEILQYFVDRYGPMVLAEPPRRGFFTLAWVMPGVAVAVGLGLLALALRALTRRPPPAPEASPDPPEDLAPYLARVDRDLGPEDERFGR